MKEPVNIAISLTYDGDDPVYVKVVKDGEPCGGVHTLSDKSEIMAVRRFLIMLGAYAGTSLITKGKPEAKPRRFPK